MAEPDQIGLVAAARAGDTDAFATLAARHRPMLLAVCGRALGDAALAEDAAQEATLLAFVSLDRLRQADRFGSWLAGIGVNVCRRWRREQARASWSWEAVQGGLAEDWSAWARDPAELAEAAEEARLLREAVAALPAGQREAVGLYYLAGLSQAQTAARVGTSVGAIKLRLYQARSRLRRRLGAQRHREERMAGEQAAGWVDVRVADVRRGEATGELPERNVVLLEEVGGDRRLIVWVGPFEGTSLAMAMRNVELPRPDSFRFMAALLTGTGGRLREVRVTSLVDGTFYAEALVDGPGGQARVDARPSDALTLALLVGAPIRVDPEVFEVVERLPFPVEREWLDQLPAGVDQIVTDRQAAWEHARALMRRAREGRGG